jgi:hypothetical protein
MNYCNLISIKFHEQTEESERFLDKNVIEHLNLSLCSELIKKDFKIIEAP